MIQYTLIRSKRKTLALHIRNATLEVRAPLKMGVREIEQFITLKMGWITKKLAQSAEQFAKRSLFSLTYGDVVLYRGDLCYIVAKDGNKSGFDDECFYMPTDLEPNEIKSTCMQIYRILAKNHIPERVWVYAKKMGVMPTDVKVNDAKSRWGSCSSKKSINFSWRLMMADDGVIDYIIVHELAHLTEMNHSPRFWAIVENVLPDYRERKARLKELQKRLRIENWD